METYRGANSAINPTPQGTAASVGAISLSEGARRCSVSLSTMKSLCRSGEIRSLRIGRRRVITLQAIADFLAAREGL
jgi:excisionase family DNA binding protein